MKKSVEESPEMPPRGQATPKCPDDGRGDPPLNEKSTGSTVVVSGPPNNRGDDEAISRAKAATH